jgi:hypothetical protein
MFGTLGENEWVTVATYDMMPHAHIARGRLLTEGIECWIADEHLVQTDWLYSPAVGGIKLRVPRDDAVRARRILDTDFSSQLQADP